MSIDSGADEGTETTTNGTPTSLEARLAAGRAAFLNGGDDDADAGKDAATGESDDAGDGAADDDSDLDSVLEAAADDDEPELGDEDEDPDADLDEDDEKSDAKGKVDPQVAKRLEAVRKTDKRLREKREADFKEREAHLQRVEAALEAKWKPRIEAAEEFERLKGRKHDPISILKALGYEESDFPDIAREAWAHSAEGAKDPKNKEAIARSRKERELANELETIKKQLADREQAEKQREKQAEQQKHVDAFVGKVTKAATDKTPLAKAFIASAPDDARVEIEVIAGKLGQQLGHLPDPRAVMIAFEKQERARLRRYGIDPKSVKPGATAASAIAKAGGKTDAKKAAATADPKTKTKPTEKAGDQKRSPRDEFIDLGGKYD